MPWEGKNKLPLSAEEPAFIVLLCLPKQEKLVLSDVGHEEAVVNLVPNSHGQQGCVAWIPLLTPFFSLQLGCLPLSVFFCLLKERPKDSHRGHPTTLVYLHLSKK